MFNFNFSAPTEIVFGKDTQHSTGEYVKKYANKVLLHYGGGSIKRSGLYDDIVNSLQKSGIEFVELGGVVPNPRLSLVHEGIELCKREGVDFIIAVGGGSVIDSSKAIAVGVNYDGDVWDFFERKLPVESSIGIGVVLTIPAAGSESSSSAVITNEDGLYKRSIGSEKIVPKFAIMNPELTFTLPEYQTGCGISDIFAHLMERYFTSTTNVDYSDRLIEASMRTLIYNAPKVFANPNDYDARAEIMWVGTIAHNGLLDCGRGGDWASHNIEHELSGLYDIAHGAGLSIIFPAWMKHVYEHDIGRFVQFAVRVFDVDLAYEDLSAVALEGIGRLEKFYQSIGMPIRLSDADIDDSDFDELASKATDRGNFGGFASLGKQDVLSILKLAL